MLLEEFASHHRLRVVPERVAVRNTKKLDGRPHCDVEHIPGKHGWIRRCDSGDFKLAVMPAASQAFRANKTYTDGKALGMVPQGRGDHEVMMFFNPSNEGQVRLALWAIGARKKRSTRPPSPKQLEARRRFAERAKGGATA